MYRVLLTTVLYSSVHSLIVECETPAEANKVVKAITDCPKPTDPNVPITYALRLF